MISHVMPSPSRSMFAFLPGSWQPATRYTGRRVTAVWVRRERGTLYATLGHVYPNVVDPADTPAGELDTYRPWIAQADNSRGATDWTCRSDGRQVWFQSMFVPRRPITPLPLEAWDHGNPVAGVVDGLCGCGCATPVHAGSYANWVPAPDCRWQWTADNAIPAERPGALVTASTTTLLAEICGPSPEDAERMCALLRAVYASYPLPPAGTDGWWSFPRARRAAA